MRILISSLFIFVMIVQALGTELSETNNGFYLAISGVKSGTNEPVLYNEELDYFAFYSLYKTNNPELIQLQYPDGASSLKVDMVGPDGSRVPKTKIGNEVGTNWDRFLEGKHWLFTFAGDKYSPAIGADGGKIILPPNAFFKMAQPGIYTYTIQMQMLRYTGSADPNEQFRNIIRFSPIKIKVEKPPER